MIFHQRGSRGLNYTERTFSFQLRKLLQNNKSFSIPWLLEEKHLTRASVTPSFCCYSLVSVLLRCLVLSPPLRVNIFAATLTDFMFSFIWLNIFSLHSRLFQLPFSLPLWVSFASARFWLQWSEQVSEVSISLRPCALECFRKEDLREREFRKVE